MLCDVNKRRWFGVGGCFTHSVSVVVVEVFSLLYTVFTEKIEFFAYSNQNFDCGENGKQTTKTLVFQRPISEDDLAPINDEQVLKFLLEQSTEYEERRIIRNRLRQIMAEQEGAQVVEKPNRDLSASIDATTTTTTTTSIDGECQLLPLLQGLLDAPDTEQTADSGTESGEDQRNGLIVEVQTALNKLSESLRDDQTDIQPERRQSLLQLVTKLQAGLAASVPIERRSSSTNPTVSNQSRFGNRRRQRPNRHTVGVSSEELADARRLIEEIALHELATPKNKTTLLQKQNSESSVLQTTKPLYRNQKATAVRNAVAKPFSSSNSTVSGNSSSVQTPTEPPIDLPFGEDPTRLQFSYRSISLDDHQKRSAIDPVANKAINESHSETEDDSTVKALPSDVKMQNNPIYNQKLIEDEKLNRFNLKKLKMKRANTIDIPKPFKFFNNDDEDDGDGDDSDCSLPDDNYNKRRRSNYLALRGPIRLNGSSTKTIVPVFEPKTENDKKFLAFINKNNETNTTKTSLWSKPTDDGTVWKNKFGNIKTVFEKSSTPQQQQPLRTQQNSAKQFWKTTEMKSKWCPLPQQPPQQQQQPKNIVTGTLKVKTFEPKPVNQFSHAPQSAFKPIPKKIQAPPSVVNINKAVIKPADKDSDAPLFLYSPKPINEPQSKQWIGKTTGGESRVMNLVASKFENPPPVEVPVVKPRKLSKETINVYDGHVSKPVEKLTAPYLVKSLEDGGTKSTVRKLSGQYDNYATYTTVKYTANPQVLKQYPVQNQRQNLQNQYHSSAHQQYQQPVQYYNNVGKYKDASVRKPNIESSRLPHQRVETVPRLESQLSVESIHEYNAVSAKVMTGPVSQQAETVRQKSPMSRDEHDIAAAMNLRNSLQKFGTNRNETKFDDKKNSESFSLKLSKQNDGMQGKSSPHSFSYSQTKQDDSVLPTKFQIPMISVVKTEPPTPPISVKMMNKADAWNQICLEQQLPSHKPSPRSSPNARTICKSKSSHSLLSVPKQFEAGMTKDEMQQKRRTMEAYLSSGNKSPPLVPSQQSNEMPKSTTNNDDYKVVKRGAINRTKTSEKTAMYRHTTIGLSRSRTLPDFVSPQLLDESNVEQAFDELFNENS